MSVIETIRVTGDGREYREVEQGVQLFSMTHAIVGDVSGGSIAHDFEFNPDSQPSFQPYVAVTRVGIRTTGAAAVGNGLVTALAGEFERHGTYVGPIAPLVLSVGDASTVYCGSWFGFANMGRASASTEATVRVAVQNVSTMTSTVTMEGFIADHPIGGRWWLSA